MIDWQRVSDLQDEIGQEDFAEVVPLFLSEVAEIIDALRAGPDLSQLEEHLHFLKGSALNLGFTEFSELCSAGERASASGQAATVDTAAVVACFERSQTAFEQGMAQGHAA